MTRQARLRQIMRSRRLQSSGNKPVSEDPADSCQKARPWGFWVTSAFSVAIGSVYFFTAVLAAACLVVFDTQSRRTQSVSELAQNLLTTREGLFFAVATIATAVTCVPLILLLARLRRQLSIGEYLGLRLAKPRAVAFWLGVTIASVATSYGLDYAFKSNDNSTTNLLSTSGSPALLAVAVVVFAPAFEEILFRGFMFAGFSQSRLGLSLSILLLSLVWTSLHFEYGFLGMAEIFGFGVLLGVSRYKTGSLLTPFLMHALWNLLATIGALALGP